MLVDRIKPNVTTLGIGKEEVFKVGNLGRILKILRNSMYSKPIEAIVREIASNARDAHREVGNADKPIEIFLPTNVDPSFKIRDYGPGITPSRMSDVFIQYGRSTKNESNEQTGGFGLGAKTPFAYSDQFQITTITPENGQNVKRIYFAFIDESEAGKMRLVQEVVTDEDAGTEISLHIKDEDIYSFKEATLNICKYWDPKPILLGAEAEWAPVAKALISNDKFSIYTTDQYDSKSSHIVIDGIQYPLKRDIDFGKFCPESRGSYYRYDSPKNDDQRLYYLLNLGITLHFNTGDLTLSANREELQYDDITNLAIYNGLRDALEVIKTHLHEDVKNCASYLDAVIKSQEFRAKFQNLFDVYDGLKWNGYIVAPKSLALRSNTKDVKHDEMFDISSCSMRSASSITQSAVEYLSLGYEQVYIINDLSSRGISLSRVKRLMMERDLKKEVYVISCHDCDNDQITNNLPKVIEHIKKVSGIDFDINLLNPILMSSLPLMDKVKGVGKKVKVDGASRSSFKAFAFDLRHTSHRSCDKYLAPIEFDFKEEEPVFVEISGRSTTYTSKKQVLSQGVVRKMYNLLESHKVNLYAIREKDLKRLSKKSITLIDKFEELLKKDLGNRTYEDMAKLIGSQQALNNLPYGGNLEKVYGAIKRVIEEEPDYFTGDVFKKIKDVNYFSEKEGHLWQNIRLVSNIEPIPDSSLANELKGLKKLYPMVDCIDSSYLNKRQHTVVSNYIKMMDYIRLTP